MSHSRGNYELAYTRTHAAKQMIQLGVGIIGSEHDKRQHVCACGDERVSLFSCLSTRNSTLPFTQVVLAFTEGSRTGGTVGCTIDGGSMVVRTCPSRAYVVMAAV